MSMSLGEMAREGEQKRKVMQVRGGALADIFTEALQLALGKGSDSSDQEKIAVRVAMESTTAQETQFVQDIAKEVDESGYRLTKEPITITPENKIVVDVIDGDSPDELQLMAASKTIDELDAIGASKTESSMHTGPSRYLMVIAESPLDARPARTADDERRRALLDSVANMARRNGQQVQSVTIRRPVSED